MTALRDRLTAEITKKLERHGLVIWDDPEKAYASAVGEVVPEGVTWRGFDGSWFALRQQVEGSLAGTAPPALVVYVPTKAPNPDPLEELRAIGVRYRMTLPTLIKNAMSGELTETRIAQIGRQCATIGEAEAALHSGDSDIDARLISVVGDSSINVIACQLLGRVNRQELAEREMADAVRGALSYAYGGDFAGLEGDELCLAAFRQATLNQIQSAIGELPPDLKHFHVRAQASQLKTSLLSLSMMRNDPELRSAYVGLAWLVDEQLHLDTALPWADALKDVDVTESIDQIALQDAIKRLDRDDHAGAIEIASARLATSWWAKPEAPNGDSLAAKWRAIHALATLGIAVGDPPPGLSSLSHMVDWYSSQGWKADKAFRNSEFIRVTAGTAFEELDDLFHRFRQKYEEWLDRVLRLATESLQEPQLPVNSLQRSIHETHIRKSQEKSAYVLVDALRYELGEDLAARLSTIPGDIAIAPAVASPPTITPVGMASVLPGADTSFEIQLLDSGRLGVSIDGVPIDGVPARVERLRRAHGNVVDLELDRVAQYSNKELRKKIAEADLVLVRSLEIDAEGENDMLAASWGSFDSTLNVLHTAVAKLLHAGIGRVVITADHGFLAVRQLGGELRIDRPTTGTGELHRRAWIGRGGTATESTVNTPLSAFGITSDLDIITPKGLGVFLSGGGLQFFHGGLSPQELVIPVITVLGTEPTAEPGYSISLEVAGGRITTGVLAVTLTMSGDLFTRESRVRLQMVEGERRVAVVVGGDGVDLDSRTIDATVDTTRVITMQVISDLLSGSTAKLEVLDAATGVRLGAVDVEVAANVIVDEEL